MEKVDSILKTAKHIHFIGIGGSGMCPIAEILHSKGYIISGSDNNESETLSRIKALGIPVAMGQRAQNIEGAQMIIYTAALLPDNPELVAAKASGIPTFERAVVLGEITKMFSNCIGICGTHGKTTVSAMLTHILIKCDKDPTAIIGGKLPLTNSNAVVGNSETMVCEACEFADTFLHLYPDVSVILNIDEDHLDYFKTLDNIINSFNKFASNTTKTIIYNGDDANTKRAIKNIDKEKISFGLDENSDYYAANISEKRSFSSFELMNKGESIGTINLNVPGKHNVYNALAALCSAINAGVSAKDAISALETFKGAGRRFEILGEYNGIVFADDYAHHPRELEVTLNAAMQMGYNNVWAVFQPFTYSRTALLMEDFARVLSIPQRCVMTEIMGSREVNTYGVYTKQLAEKIPGSVWYNTFEEVADFVVENAKSGDLVITLGCGDVYKVAHIMIDKLSKKG